MPAELSFHPPPPPQFTPARSPLFIAVTGNELLYCDDAVATPPFADAATFVRSEGVGSGGVGAPPPQASTSTIRLYPANDPLTRTLTAEVSMGSNDTFVQTLLLL